MITRYIESILRVDTNRVQYIYIYIYIYIDGVDSRYIINIEEIEKYSIYGWEDMSYNREEVHCKGGHFYAYFDKSD